MTTTHTQIQPITCREFLLDTKIGAWGIERIRFVDSNLSEVVEPLPRDEPPLLVASRPTGPFARPSLPANPAPPSRERRQTPFRRSRSTKSVDFVLKKLVDLVREERHPVDLHPANSSIYIRKKFRRWLATFRVRVRDGREL